MAAQPIPLPEIESGKQTVTADNFNRAESQMYFAVSIRMAGGIGKFYHYRDIMPIEQQSVIRSNRDTLYSSAVFDLEAGPVTINLPDAGKRFMSMIVINEDHYAIAVYYDAGSYTLTRDKVETRYVLIGLRTFVDPASSQDIEQVHNLQNAVQTRQKSVGRFEVPAWDQQSHQKVRDALLALATTIPDTKRMFGTRDQVDPVRHLIGTAMGWGGNPEKDALYLNVIPHKNDGSTIHRLTIGDVPVDGFWSISVYNAQGYFEKNEFDAYTLNNITAKKNTDGSVTILFGACDDNVANSLPTTKDWNYMVRLYRPRTEILHGSWTFPEAQALS